MYGNPYSQLVQQQMVQAQPMRGVQPMPQDAPPPPKQQGGGLMGGMMGGAMGGGIGGGGGMMALSDQHSKEQIQKLSSQNAALTQALTNKVGADGLTDERRNWYAEQEQKAKGTRGPAMSTDLARWASMPPAENRVIAQNAALRGGPAPGGPTPGAAGPVPASASQSPALAALDQAAAAGSQGNLPPTEYPQLPQNTRVAPMGPGASPQAPPRQQTVWDTIGRASPNLADLDAAYAREARGG